LTHGLRHGLYSGAALRLILDGATPLLLDPVATQTLRVVPFP